ncbi:MAG: bifunctional tRNA (5-methylaminomethyl-2-thiouridine)(34)-methyltransferase MnmD/FAD-dependent 5-carboxymethylaminomethyl-2-thiouridine(34) oxidoreductase MnmC [Marinicellaceae bacterium]
MPQKPFPIKKCQALNLKFDETGSAFSNEYQDIYFQSGLGLEEKQHVFLKGNGLPENWLNKEHFCIGETGFGTGLNFLNTLRLWHKTSKADQHLDYISCELHPLSTVQLIKALAQFTELKLFADNLITKYPTELMMGTHRINFEKFNVSLTLIFGNCVDAFESINHKIDAWYLDGFNPSKNPEMWSDRLFKTVANLSHFKTTAATFTVARLIKDRLSSVGFKIKKEAGFGKKREMLTAHFCEQKVKPMPKQPWASTFKASSTHSIVIIGAGIAGLSLADKLVKVRKKVTLIDRQNRPCLETSGNPQAMVMPSFDLNDSPEARFYLSAFLYAIRYYSNDYYHKDGVLELAFSEKQQKWQETFLTRFDMPQTLLHKVKKGLLYPQAGWLDTQGHAQHIFSSLDNYLHANIESIEFDEITKHWHLFSGGKTIIQADCLILANGISAKQLLPEYVLPTTAKHGEISYVNSADIHSQISECPHVQLNKGYITPQWHGKQSFGATFDPMKIEDYFSPAKSQANHWQRNKALWAQSGYEKLLEPVESDQSRAGIRVTTPDHLPVCGPIIDQQQFKQDYHDICHGKKWKQYPKPDHLNNLYLLTGLGSRGFTSAPLLAEFLCNQITGHVSAFDSCLQQLIHPNRFLYKSLKKI